MSNIIDLESYRKALGKPSLKAYPKALPKALGKAYPKALGKPSALCNIFNKGLEEVLKNNLEENLKEVLSEIPWKKGTVIQQATSFLSEYGVMTDFHKNTLVIGIMMESKSIKHTEFFVKPLDRDINGFMMIYLDVTRFFYIFGRKEKLAQRIIAKVKELCPLYDVAIRYRIHKKKPQPKPMIKEQTNDNAKIA